MKTLFLILALLAANLGQAQITIQTNWPPPVVFTVNAFGQPQANGQPFLLWFNPTDFNAGGGGVSLNPTGPNFAAAYAALSATNAALVAQINSLTNGTLTTNLQITLPSGTNTLYITNGLIFRVSNP